jgi:hypothetical protein
MRSRWRHYPALAVSVLAGAGLLAACSAPGARTSSPGSSTPQQHPVTIPARPAPADGLPPAPSGLSDRLVLQQNHLVAGGSIAGALVVSNQTGRPVNLTHGCRPVYRVVLTNQWFPPRAAFTSMCDSRPFILRPGLTRLAITVQAFSLACAEGFREAMLRHQGCLHLRGERMPSLPPGRYEAVLAGVGLPLPAPVLVTIEAPPGR